MRYAIFALWLVCVMAQASTQAEQLFVQVRCMVCQNQSIADSDSVFAKSLRQRIERQLAEQQSPEQIKTQLRQHYGDSVLFSPPIQTNTVFLWWFPWIVGLLGLIWLWQRSRT